MSPLNTVAQKSGLPNLKAALPEMLSNASLVQLAFIRRWGRDPVINSSPIRNTFFDRLRGRSPLFWVFILLVLSLNLWFDYYHPLGFVFDVIVVLVLLIKYLKD